MEKYIFYKFTIYNYAINENELFYIPFSHDIQITNENAQNTIDEFLCNICFCDEYILKSFKQVTPKQNRKMNDILFCLQDINENNSSVIYCLNNILKSL